MNSLNQTAFRVLLARLNHHIEHVVSMPGKNRFSAILLNEPFRDYGIHRNDPVELQVVTGTDGTRTLAILLPRDNPAGSSTSQDKNSFSEMG